MTFTITHPRTRTLADRSKRTIAMALAILALVVAAVVVVWVLTGDESTSGDVGGPASTVSYSHLSDTTGVGDWARSEGLAGLSPAGTRVRGSGNAAGLPGWAETTNVSGLSPASVRPVG